MGISSINMAMGASYGAYNQKLTQATRQKLIELNIPFDNNITEQEAQTLIKKTQASKDTKKEENSNNSSSYNSLLEKAIELAEKLGIKTEEEPNFQTLLNKIETTLEQKITANQNNVEMLNKLKGLSQDLTMLQAQSGASMGYDNTNQALMKSLEVLSLYNKNFLHQ